MAPRPSSFSTRKRPMTAGGTAAGDGAAAAARGNVPAMPSSTGRSSTRPVSWSEPAPIGPSYTWIGARARANLARMTTTLAEVLAPAAVRLETLHRRYGALLELVRRLIGVVPNCDPYLEIWPPAFRSYNVMVPNLINLPFFVWGLGAPKGPVALAMYASSRAAQCMYCSAHCRSFALRRGVSDSQ